MLRFMHTKTLSAAQVREALSTLGKHELEQIAVESGVPFHTLRKIQSGETQNPGIDTVAKFIALAIAKGDDATQGEGA